MRNNEFVLLESAERGRAGALLARAFQHDLLYKLVIRDEAKRTAFLSWLFGKVVRYAVSYGHVHTTPDLEGVACWLPPGRTHVTLGRLVHSGLFATPLKMGWAAYRRFDPYVGYSDRLHKLHAPSPHWYLWAVGVEPASQGQGIGSRLIEPMLRRADADAAACYLETGSERNVRFYEKLGFQVAGEGRVPKQGVQVWAMLRQATRRAGAEA